MNPTRFTIATIQRCSLLPCRPTALWSYSNLNEWLAFHSVLWISTKVVAALFSCYMAGATRNYCRLDAGSVYTIPPCTSLQYSWFCVAVQSHIRGMHVCLVVTCHLYFWQNDRNLLRATAVTRGWNGYRSKNEHRKLTFENKFLPPILPGLEPETFRSRVRLSTIELSPLNDSCYTFLLELILIWIYRTLMCPGVAEIQEGAEVNCHWLQSWIDVCRASNTPRGWVIAPCLPPADRRTNVQGSTGYHVTAHSTSKGENFEVKQVSFSATGDNCNVVTR